jgi:hypothetical protein
MHRREILGMLAGAGVVGLAGCSGPSATGEVVENDTALTVTGHEVGFRATTAGTELYVEAEVRNDGASVIERSGAVPRLSCAFFTADGEELYRSTVELVEPLEPGETRTFTFELHLRSDEAERYELAVESVPV